MPGGAFIQATKAVVDDRYDANKNHYSLVDCGLLPFTCILGFVVKCQTKSIY